MGKSTKKKKKARLLVVEQQPDGGEDDGGGERRRDWSALPDPALFSILKRLAPALSDICSFNRVCGAWRSVFKAGERELMSSLPPFLFRTFFHPGLYSFTERRFYYKKQPRLRHGYMTVGHSYGYVVATDRNLRRRHKSGLFLVDTFAGGKAKVPAIKFPRTGPRVISWCLMTAPPTSPDCMIVAISASCKFIQYCRLGDTQWTIHRFSEDELAGSYFRPHHAVVLLGKVYVLTMMGKLLVFEFSPDLIVTLLDTKGLPHGPVGHYTLLERGHVLLVESDGEILALQAIKLGYEAVVEDKFEVFRLDISAQGWVRVNNLGGRRALFVNYKGGALSCDPTQWGGSGNCIYSFSNFSDKIIVFHLTDGRVEHIPMPEKHSSFIWMRPSLCY